MCLEPGVTELQQGRDLTSMGAAHEQGEQSRTQNGNGEHRHGWAGAHGQRWAELRLGHQPAFHGQD